MYLVHELNAKGASLRVLDPEVTTGAEAGRLVIQIFGKVEDMELSFILSRQRAGIEAAKKRDVYRGSVKRRDDAEICRHVATRTRNVQVARELGILRMTVYRALSAEECCAPPARG